MNVRSGSVARTVVREQGFSLPLCGILEYVLISFDTSIHFNLTHRKRGHLNCLNVRSRGFNNFNPLNAELNPICYLLALLAQHFLHVSRIRVKS